ncbi:septum formation inhibitor Maf [Marinomonas hwangdonensis]|uniref:dTTP/UTP pyrophosphatase n=1 Tax=Marinomonas hwangdonensis TaxID=1053647 RepID=A0A3M8Q1J8_9GAMM|nr:Maf family protein [Marinomonas hwangdonensis]RNF49682.1 septum formation inhibitor Maf [Marinomonas hwangdonensis]
MLVLASASPRRKALLDLIVKEFFVLPVDIDETPNINEQAEAYVVRMALEKARASIAKYSHQAGDHSSDAVFIASDTSVVIDGDVLGKPTSFEDAHTMLRRLSGRSHQVITSLCVSNLNQDHVLTECVTTEVLFREISDIEIRQYWQTTEPVDKAGAYAIQGLGGVFVRHLSGSYSAVVGLPLYETAQLLAQFGVHSLEEMSYE